LLEDLKAQGFVRQDEIDAVERMETLERVRMRQRLIYVGLERRQQWASQRLRDLCGGG
jgi:hypothetical protein